MGTIPERIPATGADTAISITRAVTHHRVGLRLTYADRIDAERLARAHALTLDAEPVLGCAFRTDAFRPYWKRLNLSEPTHAFREDEALDAQAALSAFHAAEVPDEGPQAHILLLHAPDRDELGVKLSHVVADGQSVKQYAYLLADTYSRLGYDTGYVPTPDLATRPNGRDVWNRLSPEQRRAARRAKSWANPTWSVPSMGSQGEGLTYDTCTVEPDRFRRMKAYGSLRGATINDVMLAAVFRACVRQFDPPCGIPLSLMCTADLRRYLGGQEPHPISNVSISGSLDIERVDDEPFDETLRRVRDRMNTWAEQCHGAGPAASAETITLLGYRMTKMLLGATFRMAGRSGKTYPWFTNVGVIDHERLALGPNFPVGGHFYGPAAMGGSIVPAISTCRDALTVCMGYCASDTEAALIRRVLASIECELDTPCGAAS